MNGQWLRKSDRGNPAVVFVHGILSSGEKCWRHNNGAYWPELLQNQPGFDSLGIYVYTSETGFASGSYSLGDVVDDLKERLLNLDKVSEHNSIIFVCHSMGGYWIYWPAGLKGGLFYRCWNVLSVVMNFCRVRVCRSVH